MSVSSRVGIVHHEPATGGIVRIECQSQEPLLTAGRDPAAQVQKWSRQQAAFLYQADAPGLLHHEQTAPVTRGTGQVQRLAQTRRDRLQARSGALRDGWLG